MILAGHPSGRLPGHRAIGYWADGPDSDLPRPHEWVDPTWDADERDLVIAYLGLGRSAIRWRGLSRCRFCGVPNGSQCIADDDFVWPEGFSHYLAEHAVRPPRAFVDHAVANITTERIRHAGPARILVMGRTTSPDGSVRSAGRFEWTFEGDRNELERLLGERPELLLERDALPGRIDEVGDWRELLDARTHYFVSVDTGGDGAIGATISRPSGEAVRATPARLARFEAYGPDRLEVVIHRESRRWIWKPGLGALELDAAVRAAVEGSDVKLPGTTEPLVRHRPHLDRLHTLFLGPDSDRLLTPARHPISEP